MNQVSKKQQLPIYSKVKVQNLICATSLPGHKPCSTCDGCMEQNLVWVWGGL